MATPRTGRPTGRPPLGAKFRKVTTATQLPPDHRSALERLARKTGVTVSDLIRDAVRIYLEAKT